MSHKKICFVLPYNHPMPPVQGGAIETLLDLLIRENEINRRYLFTVICKYDEKAAKLSDNYKYTAFKYYKIEQNCISKNIRAYLYKFYKKVFHINLSIFDTYGREIVKYLINNDFDFIVNESANFYMFDDNNLRRKYKQNQLIAHLHYNVVGNKWLDCMYGKIVCISEYVAEQWKSKQNLDSSKVSILYNGIDIEKFKTKNVSDLDVREKYGLNADDFVLLFCGRIIPEKGILELLQSLNELRDYERLKLIIVGSSNFNSSDRTEYEEKIAKNIKMLPSKRVIFTGFIHNDNIPSLYAISDVVVMPSTWQEPAGLVQIEAMASGKVVIATKVGGIPEVITKNSAILIENDEKLISNLTTAILYLYKNPDIVKKMGEMGEDESIIYSKENYYNNFCSIIEH